MFRKVYILADELYRYIKANEVVICSWKDRDERSICVFNFIEQFCLENEVLRPEDYTFYIRCLKNNKTMSFIECDNQEGMMKLTNYIMSLIEYGEDKKSLEQYPLLQV